MKYVDIEIQINIVSVCRSVPDDLGMCGFAINKSGWDFEQGKENGWK